MKLETSKREICLPAPSVYHQKSIWIGEGGGGGGVLDPFKEGKDPEVLNNAS